MEEKVITDIQNLQDVARRQQEMLKTLNTRIDTIKDGMSMLHDQIKTPQSLWVSQSNELNELFSALAKAQSEMKVTGKDGEAHSSRRFATIEDMCAASRIALSKYGLSVKYDTDFDAQEREFLITTLGHSSGQFIRSRMYLKTEEEKINKIYQQARGSAMTYIKRYSYGNVTGVVTSDEDEIEKQDGFPKNNQQYNNQQPKPNQFAKS